MRLVGQGKAPTFFSLTMSSPALVYAPASKPSTKWTPAGQSIQWSDMAGRTLDIKPISSRVDLEVLEVPVSVLSFDKPTTLWLGPNESTLFRFNVTHESSYALKLNANDDFFAVAVLNSGLEVVARGPNQLLKLLPGDYYIRITRDIGFAPTELSVHLMSTPKPSRSRPLTSNRHVYTSGTTQ